MRSAYAVALASALASSVKARHSAIAAAAAAADAARIGRVKDLDGDDESAGGGGAPGKGGSGGGKKTATSKVRALFSRPRRKSSTSSAAAPERGSVGAAPRLSDDDSDVGSDNDGADGGSRSRAGSRAARLFRRKRKLGKAKAYSIRSALRLLRALFDEGM